MTMRSPCRLCRIVPTGLGETPGPHTDQPRRAVQGPEESSRLDAADRRGSVWHMVWTGSEPGY